jgi:siroheme synthase-like protein
VAPEISAEVRALLASQLTRGKLEIRERTFEPEDLRGVMLAIAATDDPATNLSVFEHAEGRGVLVNVVDAPGLCRFQSPSVVERGDLQIAISTHGKIPLLAQWIRRRLEILFPPAWERYLDRLAEARRRVREARHAGFAERKETLEELVNDETLELLLDGRETEFQRRWEEWSSSLPA